jgi:hypothetical protein
MPGAGAIATCATLVRAEVSPSQLCLDPIPVGGIVTNVGRDRSVLLDSSVGALKEMRADGAPGALESRWFD